ncbi:hypothetical protein AMELA_G00218690 [Ameiurus melas]|uniref:Uncharacterized protein n=1 Tax=Ameiurus melas TaxID=219545 RepID=A0A7J6A1K3_AMEME|nr:hypothetical protein AMELA_G00218690 [Ameiurus melas]
MLSLISRSELISDLPELLEFQHHGIPTFLEPAHIIVKELKVNVITPGTTCGGGVFFFFLPAKTLRAELQEPDSQVPVHHIVEGGRMCHCFRIDTGTGVHKDHHH